MNKDLILKRLLPKQKETWDAVQTRLKTQKCVIAREISSDLGIEHTTARMRLDKLVKMKLLTLSKEFVHTYQ